ASSTGQSPTADQPPAASIVVLNAVAASRPRANAAAQAPTSAPKASHGSLAGDPSTVASPGSPSGTGAPCGSSTTSAAWFHAAASTATGVRPGSGDARTRTATSGR